MKPGIQRLQEPASESHLGMALGVACVTLGLMLWAILWQSSVIGHQRELIRTLWNAKFGGMAG